MSMKQDQISTAAQLPSVIQAMPPDQLQQLPTPRQSRTLALEVPKEKGDLLTNYRLENADDEVNVSRAMSPCDKNLDAYVGQVIAVVGVVLNMAEFESQDVKGEMIEKVYASLVLDDGTIVGTTGKAVMGQLAYLVKARPGGAFSPPAMFEVRQHKTAPPKQPYYSLRRVALAKAEKKGGK